MANSTCNQKKVKGGKDAKCKMQNAKDMVCTICICGMFVYVKDVHVQKIDVQKMTAKIYKDIWNVVIVVEKIDRKDVQKRCTI